VTLVSAAVLVQHSALFQLFLREILSTLLMQAHALTAVLAQHSAPFQLSHRAEPSKNNKKAAGKFTCPAAFFIILFGEAK
jgi:hypothetical protein